MDENQKARYLRDIEYFSKKLEENPKSKVFMPLAMAYLKLGKYDEAIEICTNGLDNNPDFIAAKTILAQAFMGKGMINEAKGLLLEVATFSKDNYRANKLLGEIYRSEENMEKALYYYRTASMSSPEDYELKKLIEELALTVDATPKTLDELPDDAPLIEESEEDADTLEESQDLTDMAESLADEIIDDVETGKQADMDIFEIEAEIENLIANKDYYTALAIAEEKLQFVPEIMEKRIAEIKSYINLEEANEQVSANVDENADEIVIPEELEAETEAEVKSDELDALLEIPEEVDDAALSDKENLDEAPDLDIENILSDEQSVEVVSDEIVDETSDLDILLDTAEVSEEKGEDIIPDEFAVDEEIKHDTTEDISADIKEDEYVETIIAGDKEKFIEGIEEEMKEIVDESLEKDFEEKVENIDIPAQSKEAIEKLESWLENIAQSKEKRNV